MSEAPFHSWAEVNTAVSKAGLLNNKSLIENLRKRSYRNALQKQMEEHICHAQTERQTKEREKKIITKLAEDQKQQEIKKKVGKIKTERWYQVENLDLMRLSRIPDQKDENTGSNKLHELEDNQRERKMKTRKNFELQNFLNEKQMEIKNSQRSNEKELDVKYSENYNYYVEAEYRKKTTDRERWKNKYLFDKSIREVGEGNNYEAAYQMFLKKQMDERKSRKISENEKMDDHTRSINKTVDHASPSPAFLGLVESFDRRKQIKMIDRYLHFEPEKIYGQEKPQRKSSIPQLQTSIPTMKAEISLPQLKGKKQIPKMVERSQNPVVTVQKRAPRPIKQYTSYDFISGIRKTFIM